MSSLRPRAAAALGCAKGRSAGGTSGDALGAHQPVVVGLALGLGLGLGLALALALGLAYALALGLGWGCLSSSMLASIVIHRTCFEGGDTASLPSIPFYSGPKSIHTMKMQIAICWNLLAWMAMWSSSSLNPATCMPHSVFFVWDMHVCVRVFQNKEMPSVVFEWACHVVLFVFASSSFFIFLKFVLLFVGVVGDFDWSERPAAVCHTATLRGLLLEHGSSRGRVYYRVSITNTSRTQINASTQNQSNF